MKAPQLLAVLFLLVGCAHNQGPHRDPNNRPPVHVDLTAQGISFAEAGDFLRAEQYLASALRAGADVDKVLPALLRVCVASERYEAALAYAQRYEPNARESAELQLVLAALQMGVGQVENARRTLELVLAHNEDAQAHFLLGELYYHNLEDYASADKHYRQYLALAPTGRHAESVRRMLLKSAAGMRPLHVKEVSDAPPAPVEQAEPSEMSPLSTFERPQKISPDGLPGGAVNEVGGPSQADRQPEVAP